MAKIRALIVDDSAFMRYTLQHYFSSYEDIEVVGLASDGLEAIEQVEALHPDVVTLDVEMPRLDGLGALREIMQKRPTPVVMLSTLTKEGADVTVEALSLGAVDFVTKPTRSVGVHQVLDELVEKVRQAARAHVRLRRWRTPPKRQESKPEGRPPQKLVVIGSSTGGPGALHEVLTQLPGDLPAAVVVVQHMPPNFTRSLAERLDELSAVAVKEAATGDHLRTGHVLIAPGDFHLTLTGKGEVVLGKGPRVNGVRPAADVTMMSAAATFRHRTVGVVLTGMGHDGLDGARAIKQTGGQIIAQDEDTCVVYGMPRSVVEAGLADAVLPIDQIADGIVKMVSNKRVGARSMARSA